VRGTLLEPPADPQQGLASFTLGGTAGGIDRLKVDATRVSGRVHPAPDAAAPGNLALDATFSAPRFTDVVSARLSGARALASGPVKALLAWEDALRVGDLEAASAHATPQQAARLEACRAAVGPEVFRHQLGADIPEKRVRERQIREVILRGNRASVVLQDKRGRRVTVLVQADGAWKVE
jgi:hypothetical protein